MPAKKPASRSTSSLLKKYESVAKGKAVEWTVISSKGDKTKVIVKKSGNLGQDQITALQKTGGRPGKVTNLKVVTKPSGKPITTRVSSGIRARGGGAGGAFLENLK
jgi:hypothetical protein